MSLASRCYMIVICWMVSILCWTSLTNAQSNQTSSSLCFDGNALCFSARVNKQNDSAIFSVNTTVLPYGWIALGVGSGMSGSNIWHMYFNNSGPLFRLVDRISTGYRAPSILNSSQLVLLSGPTLDGNTYSFTFSRPLQANGYNLTTSDQTFLYAIKYNSTTRDNAYSRHTTRGKFTYNVFTSFTSDNPTNLISMDTAVVWHKYCMSFAWNFSAGFGILIARFTKSYLSKWWFRLHLVLFCVTLVLTLVGFIIMMLAHSTPHFISNHAIIGLTVVVGMVLQFMLGILINLMFQKHRRTTPLRDQVHWYFGYVLYLLAAANVMLGLSMTSETLIIFSAVVYGGFLLIFIIAQLKWGQTHDKVSLKGSQAVLCI